MNVGSTDYMLSDLTPQDSLIYQDVTTVPGSVSTDALHVSNISKPQHLWLSHQIVIVGGRVIREAIDVYPNRSA
jgi:hypothetical protein